MQLESWQEAGIRAKLNSFMLKSFNLGYATGVDMIACGDSESYEITKERHEIQFKLQEFVLETINEYMNNGPTESK